MEHFPITTYSRKLLVQHHHAEQYMYSTVYLKKFIEVYKETSTYSINVWTTLLPHKAPAVMCINPQLFLSAIQTNKHCQIGQTVSHLLNHWVNTWQVRDYKSDCYKWTSFSSSTFQCSVDFTPINFCFNWQNSKCKTYCTILNVIFSPILYSHDFVAVSWGSRRRKVLDTPASDTICCAYISTSLSPFWTLTPKNNS